MIKKIGKRFFLKECTFDTNVSIDQNIIDMKSNGERSLQQINSCITGLIGILTQIERNFLNESKESVKERQLQMLSEWQSNLLMFNDNINRRIGSLKLMEADLEETIRLALVQDEAESAIFEQNSSCIFEEFWLGEKDKLNRLGQNMKESLQDYLLAQQSKGNGPASDSVIANITADLKSNNDGNGSNNNKPIANTVNEISDNTRIREMLDEVKMNIYNEFCMLNGKISVYLLINQNRKSSKLFLFF
jgi:hypothetical protein